MIEFRCRTKKPKSNAVLTAFDLARRRTRVRREVRFFRSRKAYNNRNPYFYGFLHNKILIFIITMLQPLLKKFRQKPIVHFLKMSMARTNIGQFYSLEREMMVRIKIDLFGN